MTIFDILKGRAVRIKFKDHDEVADLLDRLHEYYELSWPKIAQLPSINPPDEEPIPVSTLAKIAKTRIVPKKWRFKFPGVGAIDPRERIAISKTNMNSAKNTIKDNIAPGNVKQLIRLLIREFPDYEERP